MPTRPLTLRVLGRSYRVRRASLPDAYGECDEAQGVIRLRKHADLFSEQDTLLHETMHAVLRQQGRAWTEAEETLVTALAPGLLAVLHDNPRFSAWLLHHDHPQELHPRRQPRTARGLGPGPVRADHAPDLSQGRDSPGPQGE